MDAIPHAHYSGQMFSSIKTLVKQWLYYPPLAETQPVRDLLRSGREQESRPYCPPSEGDLIYRLISENNLQHCYETGFGTGSTAIYMLSATSGHVTSIDWSEKNFNEIGRENIEQSDYSDRHTLIEQPSYVVMADILKNDQVIDFIYVDGWKTFDYLAYELFIINKMMPTGGHILFDDSYLPSVQRVIGLLKSHYGFEEIDYDKYGQGWKLRLFHILTRRSFVRPYQALVKRVANAEQEPVVDWTFYRRF